MGLKDEGQFPDDWNIGFGDRNVVKTRQVIEGSGADVLQMEDSNSIGTQSRQIFGRPDGLSDLLAGES